MNNHSRTVMKSNHAASRRNIIGPWFVLWMVWLTHLLPARAAEEFVSLFNGRDLSSWTNVNCAPETFSVRDGIIVSTGIPTGVIRTKRMYENFIVELEWRHLKEGGNAGFFVYSAPVTAVGQPFTKGMEIQIIDRDHAQGLATRHGDVFAIHGASFVPDRSHPGGWMRSLPREKRVKPQGEWNHYRVESRDGVLTLAVNGKVVSGGSNCIPRKGYICLESEGTECHFRNIRILELPSTNPLPNEVAAEDQGFVSLYTGLDLRGWRTEPGSVWQPKDWILECNGGKTDGVASAKTESGVNLRSEKSFRNFELIIDWRFVGRAATSSGDSGVQIRGAGGPIIHLSSAAKGSGVISGPGKPATSSTTADKPRGQWNRLLVTTSGKRVTARVNDKIVTDIASLEGLPLEGTITLLQGGPLEFANLYVRELP